MRQTPEQWRVTTEPRGVTMSTPCHKTPVPPIVCPVLLALYVQMHGAWKWIDPTRWTLRANMGGRLAQPRGSEHRDHVEYWSHFSTLGREEYVLVFWSQGILAGRHWSQFLQGHAWIPYTHCPGSCGSKVPSCTGWLITMIQDLFSFSIPHWVLLHRETNLYLRAIGWLYLTNTATWRHGFCDCISGGWPVGLHLGHKTCSLDIYCFYLVCLLKKAAAL